MSHQPPAIPRRNMIQQVHFGLLLPLLLLYLTM